MSGTFKEQCVEFRRAGHTLNQICTLLGRSKSSVYPHIRAIPLSPERIKEIREEQTERMRTYARTQNGIVFNVKGRSRLGRHPKPFVEWDDVTVDLVSHLIFDGSITKSTCVYYNRSEVLVTQVQEHMVRMYPFPPIIQRQPTGVIRASWHNVELAALIRERADVLLDTITSLPKELQRVFLRALFDDEGCVSYNITRNSRFVRAYQHNERLLITARNLLRNFGIESTLDARRIELLIRRKENIIRFRDKIGFTPGVRVNGLRSNSVWKESLEKRDILDRAIAAYRPVGTPGVHRR